MGEEASLKTTLSTLAFSVPALKFDPPHEG